MREILWDRNPLLVRALGLTPVLAVGDTVLRAVAAGAALAAVLALAEALMAAGRRWVAPEAWILQCALVAGVAAAIVARLLAAWNHPLHAALGPYLPALAASALVFDRAAGVAARSTVALALADAARHALAILVAAALLGAVRELAAYGTLFGDLALIAGDGAATAPPRGLAIAALPAGGLLAAGLLAAARNAVSASAPGRGSE